MTDDVDDIEIEMKRMLLLHEQRESTVSMRSNVVMAATAVEMVSHHFQLLELKGFGRATSKEAEAGRYDDALRRLHKKHWKSGVGVSDSPERDLAWALIQGAGMFHLKKSGILSDVLGSVAS